LKKNFLGGGLEALLSPDTLDTLIIITAYSDIQDSLKFFSRLVPTPKFRSIDVIMTSNLQKLRHIFSSSRFYFIAYHFCCGWNRNLKLDSINK